MKVKIKNKKYKIKDINSISLTEYTDLQDYIKTEPDDLELSRTLLNLFTNIPSKLINKLDESILQIDWLTQITQPIRISKLKKKYLKHTIINLDKLTVGQFVDLEYMLTNNKDNERILSVAAMLLSNKDDDMDKFNKIKKEIEQLKITDLLTLFNHYINWKTNLVKNYEGLFSIKEEQEEENKEEQEEENKEENKEEQEELSRWGWLGTVYQLSNNDILKVNKILEQDLTFFLNYISFQKEKIDIQNNKNNKR